MTTVTVDLADLEKLVFAAAAIKTIESALQQRRNDPFIREHLDFTEAHTRCTQAMREASRRNAGTAVPYDEPLTKEEAKALQYVRDAVTNPDRGKSGPVMFNISVADKAAEGQAMSVYDRLQAKGCLKVGQWSIAIVWPGEDRPNLWPDPERGFGAVLTDRGRKMLTEWESA